MRGLPWALARKYPNAGREWAWQWVFPATRFYVDRVTGQRRRHTLRCLVVLQQSEYRPEVVGIARDELARRRIPVLSPEDYWKQYPAEWIAAVGFCYRCWTKTTDESPGHTATVNFIGTRLLGSDERCVTCGSVIQTKWFCVVVPIVPLGRYRVLHATRGEYIGRRLEGPRR